jgi:hypothetical protein
MDRDPEEPIQRCEARNTKGQSTGCKQKALTQYNTGKRKVWLCPFHLVQYSERRVGL